MDHPSETARPGASAGAETTWTDGDWRSLLHAIPQIVWISDPDDHVVFLNARWTEYTGLAITPDRDALVERAVHPADMPNIVRAAERNRPLGEPYTFEYRLRSKDGAYRWHLARVVPTRDARGGIRSWVGTGTDIHDQKNATFALREANLRLAAQGERLSAALMAGSTGIFRWDIVSDTIELDEGLERLFGLDHTIRHPTDAVIALMAEHDRVRLRDSGYGAIESGFLEEEFAIQRPDGAMHWIEVRGRMVHDEEGRASYMIGAAMDVTSRRAAEAALREREADFRTLADSIPQLAWMTDETGYIHWYNRRWYEYTGATFEEMQGWGWQVCHHPDHVERVTENFRLAIERGESWEDTFPLRGEDGAYRWFLSRALPIRDGDGRVLKWFGTNTDITPQLEAAEERERLLEAERRARAEAERANRAKSEFLAVMSHELRTPLNAIGGYADLMQLGVPEPAPAAHEGYLERIQHSQKHLLGLINAVLNYARLEAGRVDYRAEDVPVGAFLQSVESMVVPQVRRKNLDFRIDDGATDLAFYADADKTLQILLNLISNAVKFTPSGGVVRVAARRDAARRVAIDVIDTGQGIPEDRQAAIFDPFVQVDSRLTRETQGAGLGLAISRDLARGMGGDLTVRSRPGEGSTFTLTLPESGLPGD